MEIETLNGAATLAMSTMEIADLTGKRHDNVVRDAKVKLTGIHGAEVSPSFEKHSSDLGNEKIQALRGLATIADSSKPSITTSRAR